MTSKKPIPHSRNSIAIIAILVIGVGYGSFLSLVPTITGKLFGAKNFSANYSLIFQAYGAAALLGITIKKSVTFEQAFMIAMLTAVAGLVVAMTIKDKATESASEKLHELHSELNTVTTLTE